MADFSKNVQLINIRQVRYYIFISYKRKSLPTANNLYYRLTTRGYSAFFDLEEMGRDNFNVQFLNYIENAKDAFVISEEGSLDGCKQENWEKEDWFCHKIAFALEKKKNTSTKFDAATKELGTEWAIPTEVQFNELITECRWVWKNVDGCNGYEIIEKNGSKIFLPAAGWIKGTEVEYRNQYGYYWTSECSTNSQFARSMQFPKNGKGIVENGYLYVGRSIRAVCVNDAVAELYVKSMI